jgi:hypothetical protein
VPSNGTVVKISTHPENDLDGEFYVHVRYDMDLMINSNTYEILLIKIPSASRTCVSFLMQLGPYS